MAALNELIQRIENPELREQIQAAADRLAKQKKFGLVFEEHLPECTPLYGIPVKKGAKVALKTGRVSEFYTVLKIEDGMAVCLNKDRNETAAFAVADLVCIAEFGEPIYPYLQPMDTVCNAPESDLWHTLIEADNYHALQLLEYLYAGKVDCIYIDPPYNTGARDWKYNNDYVDSADTYRHSKWLSFMQKRLKLAKRLLNPKDSVLIVTIDEKEYLHLGCLLEELFPEANTQMISSVINHAGNGRLGDFGRINEYIFYVRIGESKIAPHDDKVATSNEVVWDTLRRHNPSSIRPNRPKQFYPIYIRIEDRKIVKIGDPITPDVDRFSVPSISGCVAVFPVKDDGTEMMWGVVPEECRRRYEGGFIRVGKYAPKKPQQFPLQMLSAGTIRDIQEGKVLVTGHRDDGSVIAIHPGGKKVLPKNQWDKETHDARYYGTELIRPIIGDRFSYPKSLYAVTDALRYVVSEKKDAIIVDFFAGSGTTLHAVNLLNAEDLGHRKCILVTNNEVSDAEAKEMSARKLHPGDEEWEMHGIARYVTWPRTVCSIEGHDVNGNPLKGDYLGSGAPMADGFKANVVFFKLGFLDKTKVSLGRQFKELLSTLWMKAGAHGPCPAIEEGVPSMLILPENRMAILNDENYFGVFVERIAEYPEIDIVYIVTDYEASFTAMTAALPGKTTYQLYRDYLDNFRINAGRNAR